MFVGLMCVTMNSLDNIIWVASNPILQIKAATGSIDTIYTPTLREIC